MKEALFYTKLDNKKVRCLLCPHNCLISEGKRGFCGVRKNEEGRLITLVYGRIVAACPDPIEKKPLYHFYPATTAYSIATVGCNFTCLHCQNADISQIQNRVEIPEFDEVSPRDIIKAAEDFKSKTIAYTYTEPTIFYEFAMDVAELAHKKNLKNVFITNGYINRQPLERISPFLDAVNIDLKFFDNELYKKVCHGTLKPVLETIEFLKEQNKWIEITTLIIPGFNDDKQQLTQIAQYISSLDVNIPWHVTAFFPANKLIDVDSTESNLLFKAREIGFKCGLKNVYCGNIDSNEVENTYCPACKRVVIERSGYKVISVNIKDSKCEFCNQAISGRYEE